MKKMIDVNQETEIPVELPEVKDLVLLNTDEIEIAFSAENGVADLFEKIKSGVYPILHDVEDEKGRDQIKKLAYAVSRSKTAVDSFGKGLVDGIKESAKVIDQKRKFWRDSCDQLRDEIRKPLDDYEAKIEAKIELVRQEVKRISLMSVIAPNSGTPEIKAKIAEVKAINLSEEEFGDLLSEAKLSKYEALEVLENILEQSEKNDILQQKAEEERKSREADIAKRAAEEAKQKAEQKAADDLKAAADREMELIKQVEQAKALSELNAWNQKNREEEQKEQARIAQQEAIEAERRRVDQENKNAELIKIQRMENLEHRKKINREAINCMCATGLLDEDGAKLLLREIFDGNIKNISIVY